MKKIISLICALMVVSGMALAQRGDPVVIPLWPNGAPNDNHLTGEEGHPDPRSVNNVSKPELWVCSDRIGGNHSTYNRGTCLLVQAALPHLHSAGTSLKFSERNSRNTQKFQESKSPST